MTDFKQEALEELNKLDGTLVPEFVEIQDGWYDMEIKIDPDSIVCEIHEFGEPEPTMLVTKTEILPTRKPRYKKVLTWRQKETDG